MFSKNKSKDSWRRYGKSPSQPRFLFFTRIDSPKAEYLAYKKENYKGFDIIHEHGGNLYSKDRVRISKTRRHHCLFTAGLQTFQLLKKHNHCRNCRCEVISFYDVGIAGIHRIFDPIKECIMKDVDCIIVVAGMEGTLPSVIATLIDVPVIGVPTSVGYGFHGEGISALSSILQSCSPGLAAVNIDNGFGAGAMASVISRRISKERNRKALDK